MNKFNQYFNEIKVSDELKEKTMNRLKEAGLAENQEEGSTTIKEVMQDFPNPVFSPYHNYQQNQYYPHYQPSLPHYQHQQPQIQQNKKRKRKPLKSMAIAAGIVASVFFIFIILPAIIFSNLSTDGLERPVRSENPIINASDVLPELPDYMQRTHQVESESSLRELIRYTPEGWINTPSGSGSSGGRFFGCGGFLFGCAAMDWSTNESNASAPSSSANLPPPQESDGSNNLGIPPTSSTNVQIEGVDEGDIVKNDGNFIFHLSPLGLTIVETNHGYITPIANIHYTNFSPIEMYVRNSHMIIIGGGYRNIPNMGQFYDDPWSFRYYHTSTIIRIYNIVDRSEPMLERYYEIEGQYNTSRVHMDTETLFFVVNYMPHISNSDTGQRQVRRPFYRTNPNADFSPFSHEDMYYFKNNPTQNFMILGRIELDNIKSEPFVTAHLSSANIISVGQYNLYTSSSRWYMGETHRSGNNTFYQLSYISRFCLETLEHTGSVVVNGVPQSRYAIDEYNGYLRVATTYGDWNWNWRNTPDLASAMFVFNSELELVSSITNIAPYERIDSVAFSGAFGFISTLSLDSIFTIDLTDPHNPIISESYEKNGTNDYLRPIHGTPFVIAVGRDVLATNNSLQTGIRISILDMRLGTGEPAETRYSYSIFGSNTRAEVLHNPRALLFMIDEGTKQGYVGFSAEVKCQRVQGASSGAFYQGFFLFRVDAIIGAIEFIGDSSRMIMCPQRHIKVPLLKPTFSNFDTNYDIPNPFSNHGSNWDVTWQNQLNQFNKYIHRAIINQSYIYTISDKIIAGYNMQNFGRVDSFTK
ncbi:MAG: beta-propeller domain-containing protein [Firmicutes bacterium]|nr:beta-propeller domain-containing protein [Bacillota bacterium]